MGHKTFIGGVHPYDGKELSKDSPIKEVLPKGDMVYPVSQHMSTTNTVKNARRTTAMCAKPVPSSDSTLTS